MPKYVELYCDEIDGLWKITVWTIPDVEFNPLDCIYENLEYAEKNIHNAVKLQASIVDKLRKDGHKVYSNTANPDSYFWIMPKWLVTLISGGASNDY